MRYSNLMFKPKQLGTIRLELVTCGKPNCRCAEGEKHSAYYHYFWKVDYKTKQVRLRKKYVPKKKVETLIKGIDNRRTEILKMKYMNSKDKAFQGVIAELYLKNKCKWPERLPEFFREARKLLGRNIDEVSEKKTYYDYLYGGII